MYSSAANDCIYSCCYHNMNLFYLWTSFITNCCWLILISSSSSSYASFNYKKNHSLAWALPGVSGKNNFKNNQLKNGFCFLYISNSFSLPVSFCLTYSIWICIILLLYLSICIQNYSTHSLNLNAPVNNISTEKHPNFHPQSPLTNSPN